jgi:hypothetical protein
VPQLDRAICSSQSSVRHYNSRLLPVNNSYFSRLLELVQYTNLVVSTFCHLDYSTAPNTADLYHIIRPPVQLLRIRSLTIDLSLDYLINTFVVALLTVLHTYHDQEPALPCLCLSGLSSVKLVAVTASIVRF